MTAGEVWARLRRVLCFSKNGCGEVPRLAPGAIVLGPLRGLGLSAASPRTLFLKRVVAICGTTEVVP